MSSYSVVGLPQLNKRTRGREGACLPDALLEFVQRAPGGCVLFHAHLLLLLCVLLLETTIMGLHVWACICLSLYINCTPLGHWE